MSEPRGARCVHGYFYGQDCCIPPRKVPSLEDEAVTERVTDAIYEVLISTNGVASVGLSLVHLAEILAHAALTKEREIRAVLATEPERDDAGWERECELADALINMLPAAHAFPEPVYMDRARAALSKHNAVRWPKPKPKPEPDDGRTFS